MVFSSGLQQAQQCLFKGVLTAHKDQRPSQTGNASYLLSHSSVWSASVQIRGSSIGSFCLLLLLLSLKETLSNIEPKAQSSENVE